MTAIGQHTASPVSYTVKRSRGPDLHRPATTISSESTAIELLGFSGAGIRRQWASPRSSTFSKSDRQRSGPEDDAPGARLVGRVAS